MSQSVGIGTTTPDPNAALDVQSSASTPQGMYIPRLQAAARLSMTLNTTHTGLLVYDLDSLNILQWDGTSWSVIGGSAYGSPVAKETRTEVLSIPPTGFISYDTDLNNYVAFKDGLVDGGIIRQKGGAPSFAGAGVHLPDGAQITGIRLYYLDQSTENITASLFVMNPRVSTTPQNLGTVQSTGGGGDGVQNIGITHTVDNSQNFYWVQLTANGTLFNLLGTYGVQFVYSIERVK